MEFLSPVKKTICNIIERIINLYYLFKDVQCDVSKE